MRALTRLANILLLTAHTVVLLCLWLVAYNNPARAAAVAMLVLTSLILSIRSTRKSQAAVLILLGAIPFNITFQLPAGEDPYISGIVSNYLIPTLSILDLAVALTLVGFVADLIRENRVRWLISLLRERWYLFLSGALLFTAYNIHFSSVHVVISSGRFLGYLLVVGVVAATLPRQRWFINRAALILVVSVLVQSVLALWQFKSGSSVGLHFLGESEVVSGMLNSSFMTIDGNVYLRGYGTFPHPNMLAGFLLFSSLFFWMMLLTEKSRRWMILYRAGILVTLVGITVSFSRFHLLLALVATLVGIYLYYSQKRIESKQRIMQAVPVLVKERVVSLLTGGDLSAGERMELVKSWWEIVQLSPLVGLGAGRYVAAYAQEGVGRVYTGYGLTLLQPVHNIFMVIMAEYGVLVGSLFTLFVGWLFLTGGVRALEKSDPVGKILFMWAAFYVGIGLVDHYPVTLPQGLMLSAITFTAVAIALNKGRLIHT